MWILGLFNAAVTKVLLQRSQMKACQVATLPKATHLLSSNLRIIDSDTFVLKDSDHIS